MKVRAIAIATERSNAIGTVELECTPHGLVLVYLGVGSFSEDYTPGALTHGTQVLVPWANVREARVDGEELFLDLDTPATPHQRLSLVNFSTGDSVHHREVYRQRMVLRLAVSGTALVGLLVVALTVPRIAPKTSALTALFIGGLTAAGVLLLGLWADRHVARGGADSDTVREAFASQLAIFLPTLGRSARAPRPPPKLPRLPDLQGVLPRTTLAVVITLTAGLLGLVLMGSWVIGADDEHRNTMARSSPAAATPAAEPYRDEPPPPPPQRRPAPVRSSSPPAVAPPSPPPPPAPPSGDVASVSGTCRCPRADSVLWSEPIGKLSALVLAERRQRRGTHPRMELDVAAVNNSDEEIRDLTMVIEFFEQDPPPSSKRYSVAARSVYFEGPLMPGQAIKWTVEARGSTYEINNPIEGHIGAHGEEAAPTNLLADLLNANHRPVRLHGAMMLAYLGDPRAREAALVLREALREDEAPYLERLIAATGDIRACQLTVSDTGMQRTVSACVFNAAREAKSGLALRVRALDKPVSHLRPVERPALVLAEGTWKLPASLPPDQGVTATAQLDLSATGEPNPALFEVFADRFEVLR